MIFPEVRNIHSPDLQPPELPADPFDAEVLFRVTIGATNDSGEETFTFTVITPVRLARIPEAQWGRGRLILPTFEWGAVVEAVARLLAASARETWAEVTAELDKELIWEFERNAEPM